MFNYSKQGYVLLKWIQFAGNIRTRQPFNILNMTFSYYTFGTKFLNFHKLLISRALTTQSLINVSWSSSYQDFHVWCNTYIFGILHAVYQGSVFVSALGSL